MTPFKGRHYQSEIILWAIRYWRNPTDLRPWHLDKTYVKIGGKCAYLYRTVDSHDVLLQISLRRWQGAGFIETRR